MSPCVGDKPSSLRYVYDKINVNIRGLSAMGITATQYGSLLIPIIMTKLTPELRLCIARESRNEVWVIGELMDLIKQEVEAREATEIVKIPATRHTGSLQIRGNHFQSNSTASALIAQNSSIQCVYCNEAHYSASCKQVPGSQARKEILLRSGRCFNCLKPNHKSRDCDSRNNCRYCHRRHHQSICNQIDSFENKTTGQSPGHQQASQPPERTLTTTTTGTNWVPDHLNLCENHLRSLLRRLQFKPQMLLEYDKIILEQLRQGIVEYVDDSEKPQMFNGEYHYLPHYGVIRQDTDTTKLRIKYDGSAKAIGDEYSLNDCLLTGPTRNSIPKLFNILVQFRWNPVAITANIEKAFLMINIKLNDRDYLRFLWIKDFSKSQPELVHLHFTRLVFGLRPPPAVLGAVINYI